MNRFHYISPEIHFRAGVEANRRQAGGQGREEQKFFPIITRQNKFDDLLGFS